MPNSMSVDLVFYSCNMFTDIPNQWWGVSVFHWGDQIIEFHTRRFVFLSFGLVAAFWMIGVAGAKSWRWIVAGK